MYADFELYLVKCDEQGLGPSVSFNTQTARNRRPSGFCCSVLSEVDAYDTPPVV